MTGKYRSMRGKLVDMNKLAQQNELMPAIGNIRVNARGDELGPGGKIIRRREEIVNNYHKPAPTAPTPTVTPVVQESVAVEKNDPPQKVAPVVNDPPAVIVPEKTKKSKEE
jgi:hypothetical protein